MATSDSSNTARGLDAGAVRMALSRLARAPQAPWLHAEVARRMAQRLEIIRLKPEVILDWWSFTGASADVLQQALPQARRVLVEPTPELLQRSLQAARLPWWSAQRWAGGKIEAHLESDALQATAAGGRRQRDPAAHMVWANMMLHAVDNPPALFEQWLRALRVDGFVMFSCPGPGTLRELRALYQRLGWGAPTQGFIDMHDLGDMLVHAGFADPVMDQEVLSLQWDSPAALLNELRGLGGNAAPQRFAGLRSPRWRDRWLAEVEALRGADGKLSLSFEIAYGHAFKAPPRVRRGEATTVSLEDMRAMVRSTRTQG
jgi:malonyl-CoA O-methyltransferase